MALKAEQEWTRLDNVAKIFPSKKNRRETSVFRIYCELKEQVDPLVLQRALDQAILEFPNFLYVMRKGVFWHYLEQTSLRPIVSWEHKNVCGSIYDPQEQNLLFEITYYKNRINLEMYHVLSDGTGAMQFLKTIIAFYINEKHQTCVNAACLDPAAITQKASDSFQKYYEPSKKNTNVHLPRVYNLRSRKRKNYLLVMEGMISVQQVLKAAHKNKTTVTGLLAAIFLTAIHQEMSLLDERKPVVLKIPVNLRQYFPSSTARNFFGMIAVSYHFEKKGHQFSDLIDSIDQQLHEKLTKENLAQRMNSMSYLEHNPLLRIAPLPLKDLVLGIAKKINAAGETAVLSNVGRIQMPEELKPYILRFGTLMDTMNLQLTLCSFEDQLQLGFTSYMENTDIIRNFYRILQKNGIDVELRCNDYYCEKGE